MRVIGAVILTLCAAICAAQDDTKEVDTAFDSLMGDSSQCKASCAETFPLHTYDEPNNLNACQRGCRLFSICEWVNDTEDFNNTIEACSDACREAYNSSSDGQLSSCFIGCKAAVLPADERKSKLEKEDPHIQLVVGDPINSPSHLFFSSLMMDPIDDFFSQVSRHPFMMATDDSMQRMMKYVSDMMQMDSLFPSLLPEGGAEVIVISFNAPPEINTQHPQGNANTNENAIHSKTTLNDQVESNLQTNLYGRSFFNTVFDFNDKDDDWIEYDDDFDHYENPDVSNKLQEWWNCFTKKAGLPELTLLLFWISTMILLLMCCTMQFPSSRKGYEKLSIDGDLAYIKESKGRVPDFLRVYGHPEVVRFTEVKRYKPDEKIPISEAY